MIITKEKTIKIINNVCKIKKSHKILFDFFLILLIEEKIPTINPRIIS
jgi:hypothetical protein